MIARDFRYVYAFLGLMALMASGSAMATGLLTDPSSSFSFSGDLYGEEWEQGTFNGDFDVPTAYNGEDPNFSQSDTISTILDSVQSSLSLDISTDFQSGNDYLELQLNLGVWGSVSGAWNLFVLSSSSLDGSLRAFFTLEDWASTEMNVAMLWTMIQNGGGDIYPRTNSIRIVGPLDADYSNQTGFIYERFFSIPSNWWEESSVISQATENLVAGTYMVEFFSDIYSESMVDGANENASFGIDFTNSVTVDALNTIDPDGCLLGVPCPTLADADGSDSVDSADFLAWYQSPFDVTSDGIADIADEAAMAFLLGMDMVDANDNGIVDALEIAPVLPGAGLPAAVELHAAYPNPFNPMTVLSFSLPSAQPVDLAIYDVKGNRIRTLLAAEAHSAGRHEVTWNGRNDAGLPTPAGVYFFRLQTKSDVQTGRMMLLK